MTDATITYTDGRTLPVISTGATTMNTIFGTKKSA